MGQVVNEVKLWNTPAIGAFLLWRFTQGYCSNHPNGDAPVGLLHFLASAILTNRKLLIPISNRRKDLQSYARSFEDSKDSDILSSIQDRIKKKREYTCAAIDIAVAEGLLVWDVDSGKLYPREFNNKQSKGNSLKTNIAREENKAEILGKWLSNHDISTIESYLKVVF